MTLTVVNDGDGYDDDNDDDDSLVVVMMMLMVTALILPHSVWCPSDR